MHLRALLHSSDVTASKDWKFQSLAPATSLQWLSADTESRQPRSPIKGNRALGLLPSLLFHLLTVPFKESRQNLHPFVQKPQLVWFCMFQVPFPENRYQTGFYEMLAKERETSNTQVKFDLCLSKLPVSPVSPSIQITMITRSATDILKMEIQRKGQRSSALLRVKKKAETPSSL